jgi:tetratricopeptide (TPR) repeat protein
MFLRRAAVAAAIFAAACREPAGSATHSRTEAMRPADGGFVRPFADDGGRARVEVDPRDPESLYLAAQQEFIAGQFTEAADHLRKSLLLSPSAKAFHSLGDALVAQARFAEAADAYREAVRLDPSKHLSWMRLGRCLLNSGRANEGVEAYRRAQALKSDDLAAAHEEVEALLAARRDDEAVAALERTVVADPEASARDLKLIGQIRARQERWADAVTALRRAVAVQADADAFNQIGEALARLADLPGARDAFQEAARLDPKDPFAWELVAEVEEKLGRRDSAKAAFESSLKVKDRPGPHLGLARLALAGGEGALARRELDAALGAATGETASEAREIAAFALRLGDAAVAVKLLEMLATEPESGKDPALLRQLAAAYEARRGSVHGREQEELARKVKQTCQKARAAAPKGEDARCPPRG